MKKVLTAGLLFVALGCGLLSPSEWSHSGLGDAIFEMPNVAAVRVIGTYDCAPRAGLVDEPRGGSNFMVWLEDTLIVNEILGPLSGKNSFDQVIPVGHGGTITISYSTCVQWIFREIR